jgi:hypothetical protein
MPPLWRWPPIAAQLVYVAWAQDLKTEAKEGLRLVSRATELGKDDGNVFGWLRLRLSFYKGIPCAP